MKRIKLTIHTIILLVLVSFICVAQSNEQKCSLSETPDLLKDEKGKPITITPSEMGKRFISGEKPEYPGDCRCQGAVYFLLHIDAKGEVRCSQSISGHPLLRAAVVKVIKGWRFTPYQTEDGNKSFAAIMSYSFSLETSSWSLLNETLPCKPTKVIMKDSSGRILWLKPNEMLDRAIEKTQLLPDAYFKGSGDVLVNVKVNKNGNVTCAMIVNGHPISRERAMSAVIKWKFKPFLVNNKPAPFFGHVLFSFPKL